MHHTYNISVETTALNLRIRITSAPMPQPRLQAMAALPDDTFSTAHPGGPEAPLLQLSDAVRLPPPLQLKWLRTDCIKFLDLSNPGDAWTLAHWQALVGSLAGHPSLVGLRVALPRSVPEDLPLFPLKLAHSHKCGRRSDGYTSGYCERSHGCGTTTVNARLVCGNPRCGYALSWLGRH